MGSYKLGKNFGRFLYIDLLLMWYVSVRFGFIIGVFLNIGYI